MDTNFGETFELNSTEHEHVCIVAPRFDVNTNHDMVVEKKLRIDEGVMLLESKKSISKPHSLFKPQD